jgi:hypothetical protein
MGILVKHLPLKLSLYFWYKNSAFLQFFPKIDFFFVSAYVIMFWPLFFQFTELKSKWGGGGGSAPPSGVELWRFPLKSDLLIYKFIPSSAKSFMRFFFTYLKIYPKRSLAGELYALICSEAFSTKLYCQHISTTIQKRYRSKMSKPSLKFWDKTPRKDLLNFLELWKVLDFSVFCSYWIFKFNYSHFIKFQCL